MANERKQRPKPDAEQQRLKKEEQARASRRRTRQLIGLALSILVIVGAVSIVVNGVNLVRNLMDTSDQKGEYETLFAPMVWFNVLPFESVSQVDENSIKQVCIWGVLNQQQETLSRNEYGEPLVPAVEVDQYGIALFGPNFRFSGHDNFYDQLFDLEYSFDAETEMYTAPVTGLEPPFLPTVVEIVREAGGVRRVTMGYVSTRTSDNQVIQTPDYDHPAKYMDFMLRRDGNSYYLYALQTNTTYVPPQSGSSVPAQDAGQPDSLDETSSLPPVASSVPGSGSSLADSSTEEDTGSSTDDSSTDDSSEEAA